MPANGGSGRRLVVLVILSVQEWLVVLGLLSGQEWLVVLSILSVPECVEIEVRRRRFDGEAVRQWEVYSVSWDRKRGKEMITNHRLGKKVHHFGRSYSESRHPKYLRTSGQLSTELLQLTIRQHSYPTLFFGRRETWLRSHLALVESAGKKRQVG